VKRFLSRCARLLAAAALLLGSPAYAQDDPAAYITRIEGPQSPNRQGFDSLSIQQLMQRFRVPGVSIAVIRDFKIHWAKAYGVADVESGKAAEVTTLFQAASISKPVTAMAALRLAQEGKLSLDADINTILKSWKVPAGDLTTDQPVTARSLFSHTSGADDGFGFPGYDPTEPRPTLVQILNGEKPSNVGPVRFARRPYTGQKYSGGGTVIVQLALMDLTGKPFAELMREKVLDPLGMTNSTYEQPPTGALAERTSRAHNGQGKAMGTAKWHVYPEQAAAGLWTTPSDLARFAIEVQLANRFGQGKVLSQASVKEMLAPTGVGPFAVGFSLEKRGEGWYFMHSGGNWGFLCDLLAHVRKGYGVVVMTNGSNFQIINEIEARVAAAYGWDTLDKPIPR
jgi:CubicO group peptidase (beta-lactamase class C family)